MAYISDREIQKFGKEYLELKEAYEKFHEKSESESPKKQEQKGPLSATEKSDECFVKTTNQITNALQIMMKMMFTQASQGNAEIMLTEDMLDSFRELASQQPAIYPFFLKSLPSTAEVAAYFEAISQHENDRMTMPDIPVAYFKDNIQGKDVYTPAFLPWQMPDNNVKNIIIDYDSSTAERAAEIYRHIVMSILLGLPAKSVHLSFVNTQLSPLANFFTANLPETLYDKVSSPAMYHQLLERLLKRVMDFQDKYGQSIEQVNEAAGKIVEPYEVVILLDDPDAEISAQEQLIPLFEKGPLYGIYFIGLNSTEKVSKNENQDHILKHSSSYQVINAEKVNSWSASQEGGFITTMSIANNSDWAKAAFEHVNAATTRKKVFQYDWQAAINAPYTETSNEIVAPIGFTAEGAPFNFRMDVSKQHYHAFVIGATGSGKSRFLHDIILSMTAKYQPEDVELYLLDFKGVEFNCYRDFKHMRAILVDRADERITYEVIRDIKVKMEQRQQMLAEAGASDVNEYNRMNLGKHLSQIILVADECQTLFADRAKNGRLQNEMVDIIALIAQQGRAYGVHLLLSTQSLVNAPQLGKEILNQIGEHYILPCLTTDAARLVPDTERNQTEKVVATMEKGKGQCYYQGADGNILFTFNYVEKGDMQKELVESIQQKASTHASNGQSYFSGSLQIPITQAVADYIVTKGRKNIVTSPGQIINLEQTPLTIPLKDDLSENIALFGINDRQFVTRTTLGVLASLMLSNRQKGLGFRFVIFDCLDDDEAEYLDVLDEFEKNGLCDVIAPRKRNETLKQLCDSIASGAASPTILTILGQERFRELKLNQPIVNTQNNSSDSMPAMDDIGATLAVIHNITTTPAPSSSAASSIKTVKEALNYIMDEGPSNGVHTIIQVDKPVNFMFPQDAYFRKTDLYAKCKHVIMMRSEEAVEASLMLPQDISLSKLEDNPNRLRAYYYNEEADKYQLFTPYILPDKETINNIIQ